MKKLILSLLFFVTGIASATQFPDKSDAFALTNFSAGLYTNAIGNKLPPNSAKLLRNFLIDERTGSLYRNNGYSILGSTTGLTKVNFILPFIKNDNSVEFLVTDNSSLLSTVDFITYKPIRLGFSGSNDLFGIQYKQKTWWTNGIDAVCTYDGSTVTVMDGKLYGTLQTPNIPRGKCIEADLKRIWIGGIPTDNSAVYWSTLYSTDGVRVDPDDYRAWQSINTTSIGLGDGQSLTALKTFNGTLIASKERSIYSRYGDSDTSFIFIKTKSRIGFISQSSIIEHENILFGHSYDGFYAFDGDNVASISDYVKPDFANIRADVTKNVSNTWDTQTDFNRGVSLINTTATNSGTLTTLSNYVVNTPSDTLGLLGVEPAFGINAGALDPSSTTAWIGLYTSSNVNVGFVGRFNQDCLRWWKIGDTSGAGPITIDILLKNFRTGTVAKYEYSFYNIGNINELGIFTYQGLIEGTDPQITASDLNTTKVMAKFINSGVTGGVNMSFATTTGRSFLDVWVATTAQYISDVATITNITNWGTLDSAYNSNGNNVNFYYRASTGIPNISTYPWISIIPGSVIGSSQNNTFIQWASTITVSTVTPAILDYVAINHSEGNASITRSFGVEYNGRLMMGVSTESTGNYPLIYDKSRLVNQLSQLGTIVPNSPAWTTLQGINVRCMVKYQTYLYGGMASTGTVIRMDYGTNYGGDPIVSVYESADLDLGSGFTLKDVWEYMIDANSSNGATLRVGTSVNNRVFNYNNVLLDDTNGNSFKYIHNPNGGNATFGKLFRIRFENSELDKNLVINNFGIVYKTTKIR
jgi:hypothetical protein